MRISKKKRDELRTHCDQFHDDDLINPKEFHLQKRRPSKRTKKALQVARQVFETLQLVLMDSREPLLDSITLLQVEPAPDSRRMRVLIRVDSDDKYEANHDAVLGALARQTGRLRCEIARSINRKKTPQIFFEIANLE